VVVPVEVVAVPVDVDVSADNVVAAPLVSTAPLLPVPSVALPPALSEGHAARWTSTRGATARNDDGRIWDR